MPANLNFVNVYVDAESMLKAFKKNKLDTTMDGRDEASKYVWLEYEGADKDAVQLFHEVENNRTNNLEFAVGADDIVIWRAIPIKSVKTKEVKRHDGIGMPLFALESYQPDDKRFDVVADAIMLGGLLDKTNAPEQDDTMIDKVVYQGVRGATGNGKSAAGVINRAEPGDRQGYNVGLIIVDLLDRGGEETRIVAEVDPLLRGKIK